MDRLGAATMTADSAAALAPLGYDKMGAADAIRSVLSGPVPHARVRPPLLYEALQLAADQFHGPPEPGRRRIIVVWTHNQAKPDEAMRKAVVARLQDASGTVAGIVCPVRRLRSAAARPKDPPLPGPRYPPAPRLSLPDPEMRPEIVEEAETHALDPIADGTGGRIVRSAALDSVDWHEFLGRERWRYRLGFYAPPDLPGGSERPRRSGRPMKPRPGCGQQFPQSREGPLRMVLNRRCDSLGERPGPD